MSSVGIFCVENMYVCESNSLLYASVVVHFDWKLLFKENKTNLILL